MSISASCFELKEKTYVDFVAMVLLVFALDLAVTETGHAQDKVDAFRTFDMHDVGNVFLADIAAVMPSRICCIANVQR